LKAILEERLIWLNGYIVKLFFNHLAI